jgi:hypothetical protein
LWRSPPLAPLDTTNIAFVLSPNGERVAYSIFRMGLRSAGMLLVASLREFWPVIVAPAAAAYFFSPDSTRISFAGPRGDRVSWCVWHENRVVFESEPTPLSGVLAREYLPFQPQYHLSASPWTPDSAFFVFPTLRLADESGDRFLVPQGTVHAVRAADPRDRRELGPGELAWCAGR